MTARHFPSMSVLTQTSFNAVQSIKKTIAVRTYLVMDAT